MCRDAGAFHHWLTKPGAFRVPQITVYFWVIKALSTAMGESTSDYSVHRLDPKLAVCLGFVGFVVALVLQFSMAPLHRLDVLARGRQRGRVRHHGRRCPPRRLRRPLRRLEHPLRRRAGGGVRQLAQDREDAVDPQRRHASARGVLLGLGRGDLRLGHGGRRPDGDDVPPRLPRLGLLFAASSAFPPSATGACAGTRSSASGSPTSSPVRSVRPSPTGWASPRASAGSAGATGRWPWR